MRKSDFKVYATKTDCVIKKYTGKESTVEVPAFFQINGVDRPVTKIAAKAFRNCHFVEKEVIDGQLAAHNEFYLLIDKKDNRWLKSKNNTPCP